MKFFTTLCLFICLSSIKLVAQDYTPLRKGLTYQYATANRDTLITLRVDSVYALGSDSIFELDKKYFGINSSINGPLQWENKTTNIVGKRIIKSPKGVYSFITSSDTLLLMTTSPINTSWFFSKKRNLQATVLSKTYESILGVMDSIVTIGLSNGKEIKISKSLGLVSTNTSFEYILPDHIYEDACVNFTSYKLDAIKELKLGSYFVTLENIYNFEVGDKWGQLEESALYPRPLFFPRNKIYYEVISKELIEGTSSYDFKIRRVISNYYKEVSVDTLSLEQYRRETYDYNSEILDRLTYNVGLDAKRNDNFITYIEHDSLKVQSIINFESAFYHVYSPGIGLISYYDVNWGGGPNEYKMTTVCYTKGDKTFGNCEEWLAIILDTKPAMIESKVGILPNPASEYINIEYAKGADYELIDCYGSAVFNGRINSDQEVISVNSLEEGLYYLKLETVESSIVRKIIVRH
ncbi:MAG: T9SS type A sorting domain-containing protein [Sporocytophaga sp.]|uniref:T9SS type A sorting domain-containing protein n=1 Tax=Sporocytophaga sp. TaxID=2231183 RepID=UPI001AFFF074|nr:T9SS type A sorting domain-containing protein [Sporocytophaga sp.]MBO9698864.1 T9SS type A sorting domain-containing protein [Sporocytophaga sp.]